MQPLLPKHLDAGLTALVGCRRMDGDSAKNGSSHHRHVVRRDTDTPYVLSARQMHNASEGELRQRRNAVAHALLVSKIAIIISHRADGLPVCRS